MKNIPLFKVFVNENSEKEVGSVLRSGYIGQGTKVDQFEEELSNYFGNPYVNTLNAATSGLHLALHILKEESPNCDEVLTTPLTCTATNFPIVANGLKIKWVDLDPNTCNLDLTDLKGKMIGNHGNTSVFSFQAIKHLTTGDGGAILSSTDQFHKKAKLLRWYGLDRTSSFDFRCEQNIADWGFKFHMNDIAATIGLCNLPNLPNMVKKHHDNYQMLYKELTGIDGLETLENRSDVYSSSWIMTILVKNRNDFMRKMKECGIGVSRVHDRNDKHDCLKEFKTMLPNTDYVCNNICCIPCGWWVNEEDRQYIADSIKKGW